MAPVKAGQKQHVDPHRKIGLRNRLIKAAGQLPAGAIYVPFCGDGDLAVDCYLPLGREIFACDLDVERVKTCRSRLPGHEVVEADADSFPFAGQQRRYAIADFDSYSYPYAAFRSWWDAGLATSPCVVFFTDGQCQPMMRTGAYTSFAGEKVTPDGLADQRAAYNAYFTSIVLAALEEHVKPWRIVTTEKYLRGAWMLYWGAILARPSEDTPAVSAEPRAEGSDEVENALREAAVSGNVRAIELWLERHGKTPEPPASNKSFIDRLIEMAEENLNGGTRRTA